MFNVVDSTGQTKNHQIYVDGFWMFLVSAKYFLDITVAFVFVPFFVWFSKIASEIITPTKHQATEIS